MTFHSSRFILFALFFTIFSNASGEAYIILMISRRGRSGIGRGRAVAASQGARLVFVVKVLASTVSYTD